MMRTLAWSCLLALAPSSLLAQGDCFPGKESNEAKTFAILSVPLAFTGARAPVRAPHGVSIGVEVASLPGVDRATATPTICRPGKGPENTAPIPLLVRPRLAAVVGGFLLEAAWIPPLRVSGVKANLISLAVARPFAIGRELALGLRVEGVFGALHAPIVCDKDAVRDALSECFGGTLSDDRWRPGVLGVEAVVSGGHGKLKPHLGAGYTLLRPRFQVNFTNAQGETDRRRVEVDLQRTALFGGVTFPLGALRVTAEGYGTLGDAVTARLVVRAPLAR
ncbi:MAG: hypothetical protein ABJC19_06610 [Gemmatimonadota bacterium]